MSLQEEIDKNRQEIHTDGYPMSIGELVNLYRDGELDLHPEFQRFFRWEDSQKSRWVESILLGIPLPSIFVVQRDDGVWDVIDGLQRLSTIFELMGELKQEDKSTLPMLTLQKTKYLPGLEDKKWKGENPKTSLSSEQQRYIKRAKLDIKIIQRESHESAKYELFQRLNTGGSTLSPQEVRSCILISVNRTFYQWVSDLAKLESFQNTLPLTERHRSEQYDLELAIRFLSLKSVDVSELKGFLELGEFLTEKSVAMASNKNFPFEAEAEIFSWTFEVLNEALQDDVFRRYAQEKGRFLGGFLISAFEVIALGLAFNRKTFKANTARIVDLVKKQVWANPEFLISSGLRATQRLPNTIPLGRGIFKE